MNRLPSRNSLSGEPFADPYSQRPLAKETPKRPLDAVPCSLTVAFDIDGTWTLDPQLFNDIADMFIDERWTVIIVTGRDHSPEKLTRLGLSRWPIVVSGPLLKEEAARQAGYKVNVWIDDMPGMIQRCQILGSDLESENNENKE